MYREHERKTGLFLFYFFTEDIQCHGKDMYNENK